jgi:hypothetical protein
MSAEMPAHHALKGQIAQSGHKIDGGENDAALQSLRAVPESLFDA